MWDSLPSTWSKLGDKLVLELMRIQQKMQWLGTLGLHEMRDPNVLELVREPVISSPLRSCYRESQKNTNIVDLTTQLVL